jgi:SpoVK/Ycf46/Vps4 family AAA+-type ATPase
MVGINSQKAQQAREAMAARRERRVAAGLTPTVAEQVDLDPRLKPDQETAIKLKEFKENTKGQGGAKALNAVHEVVDKTTEAVLAALGQDKDETGAYRGPVDDWVGTAEPTGGAPAGSRGPSAPIPVEESEPIEEASGTNEEAPAYDFKISYPDPNKTLDDYMAELNELTGMDNIKDMVRNMIEKERINKLREEAGLKNVPPSRHMQVVGPPGTGKTTVLRILAGAFHAMGILKTGQLVEVDRSALVGAVLGESEAKTKAALAAAKGGLLLVDEAYALTQEGDAYGSAALVTLLKALEDDRAEFIAGFTGYPELMKQFSDANPGMESRVPVILPFMAYKDPELMDIVQTFAKKGDYKIGPAALKKIQKILNDTTRDRNFGNARFMRVLFEQAQDLMATRLKNVEKPTREQLMELKAEDFQPPAKNDGKMGVEE